MAAKSSHHMNFPNCRYTGSNFSIELNCRGNDRYTKVSYPVKYGLFSRIETRDHIFEFNLNHDLCQARAKTRDWLHPSEWLKRTVGNDWVYYSSGGYAGVVEAIGEYYLPNLTYPTNSIVGGKPFNEPCIQTITGHWPDLIGSLEDNALPEPFFSWLNHIKDRTPSDLVSKAQDLFDINGSRVTVLPPDARHVDYNIIPVTIADGCLYKCQFCRIKNKKPFAVRSAREIHTQLDKLAAFYGEDLINYNALFLGEHDALQAGETVILNTLDDALQTLKFQESYMKETFFFMFASPDSLLNTTEQTFKRLNALNATTFINVGLESFDDETLQMLGKPVDAKTTNMAFAYLQHINQTFFNIEVTCNIVMDDALPQSHHEALLRNTREKIPSPQPKGTVYLSPLKFGQPSRAVLYDFYRLKTASRFPTFLYIIQRL